MSKSVLVECLIHRPGGTQVVMPDKAIIHFRPDGHTPERHVAIVREQSHLSCLKAVPEAYAFLGVIPEAPAPADLAGAGVKVVADAPLMQPAPPVIETHTITAEPVVAQEPTAQQAGPAEGADKTDAVTVSPALTLSDMSEDEVRAAFEREVGRKPRADAKMTTMIAQIEAKRLEIGGNA